jgi:hypothetical protein
MMFLKKSHRALLAITLVLIASLTVRAQQSAEVTPVASSSFARLLPETLGGQKATSGIRETSNLSELVGEKAAMYQEYLVTSAAAREYSGTRIEVFQTQNQVAAFGLFTFNLGALKSRPLDEELGSGEARIDNDLVFSKGSFFVRVTDSNSTGARATFVAHQALARAVSAAIVPANPAVTRPLLLDSLPARSQVIGSERYFLGPESMNAFVAHSREMFDFAGDAEAVAADYAQAVDQQPSVDQKGSAAQKTSSNLRFVIVEYHTPQLATDAMTRASAFLSSLADGEQQQIILKRTGNYIVEATAVRDRELAESLVSSVEYPYTVKWLRNPLWPTNDPFRARKAAEMLLSTFGLLGLILLTVLGVGTVFGATVFLKRRKRQQEIFSDAGGMLRLDIDQIESAMLGLPPQRSSRD